MLCCCYVVLGFVVCGLCCPLGIIYCYFDLFCLFWLE